MFTWEEGFPLPHFSQCQVSASGEEGSMQPLSFNNSHRCPWESATQPLDNELLSFAKETCTLDIARHFQGFPGLLGLGIWHTCKQCHLCQIWPLSLSDCKTNLKTRPHFALLALICFVLSQIMKFSKLFGILVADWKMLLVSLKICSRHFHPRQPHLK